MIKNFKDIVILLITTGVLILLAVLSLLEITSVALEENRPVDESVITLNEDVRVTGLNRHNRRLYWRK
jgi:hypothetical protein